jgi:arylsulfatase A-like enzyme
MKIMKKTFVLLVFPCFIFLIGCTPEKSPNVILILTDDQGYGDLSCLGNPVLKTPVLDDLHSECVRFTDFHVAPMCTPTRGQLMTGRDAMNNGATAVCLGRSMIREEIPTMADIFKTSGYYTAHFGKWHLGDSYPYRPQDRGFEVTVHHGAWGIGSLADNFGNDYWDDVYFNNEKPTQYHGYCTDVWFDLAIDYMKSWKNKNSDKPFFLYLATNCPHGPHRCDDKYSDPYIDKVNNLQVAKFFGQIANIDENMGRLLSFLDEKDLSDNTILIYMTDNGSSRGYDVYNAGMRGHKTMPYEGGHRVPCFIKWPQGSIKGPKDIDETTQVQDILPTLIDLCNLAAPNNTEYSGKSLAPLIYGEKKNLEDRMLVVQYDNPYAPTENLAVLWNKWRLVKNSELYDISADPGQLNDISAENPEVVKAMRDYYNNWWNRTEPLYEQKRYIHVGSIKQNPVMLYSSDWTGSYADNMGNLRNARGRTGYWNVIVETKGKYDLTLSRWHPDSGDAIDGPSSLLPEEVQENYPVSKARLRIGSFDKTIDIKTGQKSVKFNVDLEEGENKIETWLMDKEGKELFSAFYTEMRLLR